MLFGIARSAPCTSSSFRLKLSTGSITTSLVPLSRLVNAVSVLLTYARGTVPSEMVISSVLCDILSDSSCEKSSMVQFLRRIDCFAGKLYESDELKLKTTSLIT